MMRLVIMGSGFSRRMGRDKLLADLGGKPLIAWVIEAAQKACIGDVTVIYREPGVQKIAEAYGVAGIYNSQAESGQSAGIRLAVASLPNAEAYLFLAGDQPLISHDTLQRMAAAYRQSRPDIVTASWQGKGCLPTLFDGSMADSLLSLTGDRGGRALIESGRHAVVRVELNGVQEDWDADTPEDLRRIENWLHAAGMTGRHYDEEAL